MRSNCYEFLSCIAIFQVLRVVLILLILVEIEELKHMARAENAEEADDFMPWDTSFWIRVLLETKVPGYKVQFL